MAKLEDMALIYSTFATLMEEGVQVACTYGVLLQKWFAEPTALTTHERICDHIGVFGAFDGMLWEGRFAAKL